MARQILKGVLLDERVEFTLADLSRACSRHAEWVVELVEEGILEPQGQEPADWRFSADSLSRARRALHLQRDLRVNLAGAALALDLMEQLDTLRTRLRRLEYTDNSD